MQDILVKAGCFIAIIILGYTMKKIGVLHQDDFMVLSKIVIRITTPAAIAVSFAGKEIDLSLLLLILLFLLFREDADEEVLMALGLLLIL